MPGMGGFGYSGGQGVVNSQQGGNALQTGTQFAQQAGNLAGASAGYYNDLMHRFFGRGGSLSGMMNPASMNVSSPTGPEAAEWNNAQGQIASDYAKQRGTLAQNFANQGAGATNTPNGFYADQANKLARGEADTRGSTWAGLTQQSQQRAQNNFWNANQMAGGLASGAASTSLGGRLGAANVMANFYGTAMRPKNSSSFSISGGAGGF
ncbi:MAG TPA: hypothetical protein VKU44_05835 [Terriglobia bacterium]|nr:hypothetical protein [Terriglobia bacterium]